MADRAVRQTGKDSKGNITALCDSGSSWGSVDADQAIRDIEGRVHTYHVPWTDGRTEIGVVYDPTVTGGRYLRTDHDETSRNNLDDLPDC